jgi:phosphatidylserine synthase
MVSRIPYRRFQGAYFLARKPFSQVMTAVLVLATFWLLKAQTLLLAVLWYAASGPVFLLIRSLRKQSRAAPGAASETSSATPTAERKRA